jgi:hypothetical protein
MAHVITLEEKRGRAILQTKPDFWVLVNGQRKDQAYFNMRGYRVGLPLPDGRTLDPGEISLAALKREIGKINREAKQKG